MVTLDESLQTIEPEKEWWQTKIMFCNYRGCNGFINRKDHITKNIVRLYCENGCVDNLILDNKDGGEG